MTEAGKKTVVLTLAAVFCLSLFSVVSAAPDAIEIDPVHGCFATKISIKGSGFGEQQSGEIPEVAENYRFHSCVTFYRDYLGYPLVATRYVSGWSDTMVRVRLIRPFIDLDDDFIKDQNEIKLIYQEMAPDFYDISFHTIYFYDNGNGYYDGDDLVDYVESTDVHTFKLTIEPCISTVRPSHSVDPGEIIEIAGYNLGDGTDGTLWLNSREYTTSEFRIKDWTKNLIKFRIPFETKPCDWFQGGDGTYRNRKVWVTVDGVDSNVKRIKVLKPGSCP